MVAMETGQSASCKTGACACGKKVLEKDQSGGFPAEHTPTVYQRVRKCDGLLGSEMIARGRETEGIRISSEYDAYILRVALSYQRLRF